MRSIKYIFLLLFATTCFAQQQNISKNPAKKSVEIKQPLPGLENRTLLEADSIFSITNVTEMSERIATEYFSQAQEMKAICDSLWEIRKHEKPETTDAEKWYLKAMDYLKTAPYEFKAISKKAKKHGRLNSIVLEDLVEALIPQISKTYGNAIRYNRFNIKYYQDFAKFLEACYEKTGEVAFIDQAIEQHQAVILKKKANRLSYSALGRLYFNKKQWDKAYENYRRAANILKGRAIFALKEPELYFDRLSAVPIDTNLFVSYLYNQAESKIHLYEAQPALDLLRTARKMTPNPTYKEQFKNRIKWILWDDGNIRASELRDQAFAILNKKEYETAKNDLINLLDLLKTTRTKDEINYRIAQIDFTYLKNDEGGAARLFEVIKHTITDSLTGVPVDSMHQQYFNSFGRMCFALGSKYLKIDMTYAYIYFAQAAKIACEERAKAYIQLADLSLFNPRESIILCKKALHYDKYLDENSRRILFETLYKAYRKLGDFAAARDWYDKSYGN